MLIGAMSITSSLLSSSFVARKASLIVKIVKLVESGRKDGLWILVMVVLSSLLYPPSIGCISSLIAN